MLITLILPCSLLHSMADHGPLPKILFRPPGSTCASCPGTKLSSCGTPAAHYDTTSDALGCCFTITRITRLWLGT